VSKRPGIVPFVADETVAICGCTPAVKDAGMAATALV
jgi:hypothetical protein